MTTKPLIRPPPKTETDVFPEPPPRDDMQNPIHLHRPGYLGALSNHFGNPDSTLVLSEVPVGWSVSQREGLRSPDLIIAFNVDLELILAQQGYGIVDLGKPPDFVLEVASQTTGRIDYLGKRRDYAAYGIPEYWRFDPSGGRYHNAHLAGDRLVGGAYSPIDIVRVDESHFWGHSEELNLDLYWEEGKLRWWDPVAQRYLNTYDEQTAGRVAEREGRIAEREGRIAEREGRIAERERRMVAERERDEERETHLSTQRELDEERETRLAMQRERDAAEERLREIEAENRRLRGQ